MNALNLKVIMFITLTFAVLAGCRSTAPISSLNDVMISHDVTKDEVRSAIVKAASMRGWVISETNDSELQATLNLRQHEAVVRIPYSDETYSIIYVSSVNLDAENNRIHANYNRWVNNLSSDIRALLQVKAMEQ